MDEDVLGPAVPDAVRDVWSHFGGLHMPTFTMGEQRAGIQAIYQAAAQGKCMTCQRPVAEQAQLCVNLTGITELYCSIKCLKDMYIRGFLTEQYDDLVDRIKFRAKEPMEND